ncbi:MAG TPA: hypothetical protein VH370_25050 [Humisphaera sp.]|jgi:hypothetical protein|nr:hypothetical protein [Humisphaera sp.]
MKTSSDPSVHRHREQQIIRHVERLLNDERLRLDTTQGRRPATGFIRDVTRSDRATDLKRLMSEMNVPDRELQNQMPIGETLEVALTHKKLLFMTETVGRMRVVCVSPTKALIKGEPAPPMEVGEVQRMLGAMPPSLGGVPITIVLVSTSGFTLESHELADRRPDRTVILVEPNGAGGWMATGPAETKALADLFDPEGDEEKRQRLRQIIDESKADLLGSGIAADKIAGRAQLPVQHAEAALKEYAQANAGLVAKRLDGRVVLFREGSAPPTSSRESGGTDMPLLDRVKALFARKGENEKKITYLSERRAALSQQRDRAYEDMATMEQQEGALKRQFQEATGSITKRRVTAQMLQLRKEVERRQQLLAVLNQQIEVVSTHLHNLELVHQGQTAQLPDTEELTADAVKAEEMLAELQSNSELAGSIGTPATAGMNDEEKALYEELERETGNVGTAPPAAKVEPAKTTPARKEQAAAQAPAASQPPPREPAQVQSQPRRSEPEAG